MKTLITIFFITLLAGCNDSQDFAFSQARAFFYSDCTRESYRVNQTDEGKLRTITITCAHK